MIPGITVHKDVTVPASSAKNTMARQWELLKLLPGRHPGLTAQEICQRLSGAGYQVSKRTIERDLIDLSQLFPLQCNDKGMPYGWYWMKDRAVDLPGLALGEALTLRLVEDYIRPLVPAEMLTGLESRFRQARQKLQTLHDENTSARWLDKVASVHPELPLLPPQLDSSVLEMVQSALLDERQVQCSYYSAHADRTATHTLNPLGLVQRGQITYLVATAFPHRDVRLWAVHRIRSAEVSRDLCIVPDGFTLKGYIESGAMAFGVPKIIELKAWITNDLARLIGETPLAEDMTLENAGEGKMLSATVPETWQLHWWALSHAGNLVVLSPPEFRSAVKQRLERAQEMYSDKLDSGY